MRKEYNKLVRDRIPEIILHEGRNCETATMSESEYLQALREKLVEEAQEAAEADPTKLVTELADLHEIMDALAAAYSIEQTTVLAEQKQRRAERGGFSRRIRLLATTDNEGHSET